MSTQTWTLTDTSRDLHESDFCITASQQPAEQPPWRVTQRRLRGGLSDGVDLVEIDNGRMRLWVLPTRGMGIWKAQIGEERLGWRSPVRGPVHPQFVPIFDPSGLGWLEGFDELLVRCGLESNGAPEFDEQGHLRYPLHGRIANRAAHHVEVTVDETAGTIALRGIVEETRFHFQKLRLEATVTTTFDSTSWRVRDTVENFGGTPAEMQLLYHFNIGEPLLAPGHQIVAPVGNVETRDGEHHSSCEDWDRFGPAVAGQPEQCFYCELLADSHGQTQVLLRNERGTSGTALRYDAHQLPCFTLWKNQVAHEDGYVTGLEPGTNFPNPRCVESRHGRVVPLAPGETWSTELVVDRLTTPAEVRDVETAIHNLK